MKWLKEHWQMTAWVLASLVACTASLVAVGSEWNKYTDVKEAVKEQKGFNEEFRQTQQAIQLEQAVIRTNTDNIKELLDDIKKELKDR